MNRAIGVVAVAAGCAAAWGQSAGERPVVEGTSDVSPLADSLELRPIDLRLPSGFDRVYEVPTGEGSLFARIDGGLTAVFPRSEYTATPYGAVAEVPAGTVWVIGQTPRWLADQNGVLTTDRGVAGAAQASPLRVDMRAGAAPPVPPMAPAPLIELPTGPRDAGVETGVEAFSLEDPGATPWGSDADRGERMAALLARVIFGEDEAEASDGG